MRFLVVVTLASLAGCVSNDADSITDVQADLGLPDAISDSSGDQQRFYSPHDRPAYEWPADSPRTFYYLYHDLQVSFTLGRVVEQSQTEPSTRRIVEEVRDNHRLQLTGDARE